MRFLPREEKFFEFFLEQTRLICEAATLLAAGVSKGNSSLVEASARVSALEKQADEVLHKTFIKLNQTFITPIDPEDIHSLATHLDDIIDNLEELAHRMVAYKIEPIPPVVITVANQLVAGAGALQRAFQALRSNEKLIEHCIAVSTIEEEVDGTLRDAIRDLFAEERDPIRIMKLKEIYDLLETTTDSCEDVSVALQNVVVKNS